MYASFKYFSLISLLIFSGSYEYKSNKKATVKPTFTAIAIGGTGITRNNYANANLPPPIPTIGATILSNLELLIYNWIFIFYKSI